MKISRRKALSVIAGAPALLLSRKSFTQPSGVALEIASGPFRVHASHSRTWTVPDWYRDAKFGIWAHWGPQSAIEYGDWYARNMYVQGSKQYDYHVKTYGHPTKVGYKDVIPVWKADRFDADHLFTRVSTKRLERSTYLPHGGASTTTCSTFGTRNPPFIGTPSPWDRRKIS